MGDLKKLEKQLSRVKQLTEALLTEDYYFSALVSLFKSLGTTLSWSAFLRLLDPLKDGDAEEFKRLASRVGAVRPPDEMALEKVVSGIQRKALDHKVPELMRALGSTVRQQEALDRLSQDLSVLETGEVSGGLACKGCGKPIGSSFPGQRSGICPTCMGQHAAGRADLPHRDAPPTRIQRASHILKRDELECTETDSSVEKRHARSRSSWWKHKKPFGKNLVARQTRQRVKGEIRKGEPS